MRETRTLLFGALREKITTEEEEEDFPIKTYTVT